MTLEGARALTEARARPAAVPRRAAAAAASRRCSRSRTSCASSSIRRGRSCASGSASASADFDDEVDDALPVELDGLEKWEVGERMLDARLAGADTRAAYRAEIARGALPPGRAGQAGDRRGRAPTVEAIVAAAREVAGGPRPASDDVTVALPDGRTLSGTVRGVHGDVILQRHLLARRARSTGSPRGCGCCALTAARPDRSFSAVTVGRGARDDAAAGRADPADRRRARCEHLATLVELYDRGDARAAAARLPDLGGVRGRRRGRGAAGVGVRVPLPQGGPRARAPARLRRRSCRSTTLAHATTSGDGWSTSDRSAATPRCGTAARSRRRAGDASTDSGAFDVCGPLPRRASTVLEASAGHGQDVHDRRARRALRRRGRAAVASCCS